MYFTITQYFLLSMVCADMHYCTNQILIFFFHTTYLLLCRVISSVDNGEHYVRSGVRKNLECKNLNRKMLDDNKTEILNVWTVQNCAVKIWTKQIWNFNCFYVYTTIIFNSLYHIKINKN